MFITNRNNTILHRIVIHDKLLYKTPITVGRKCVFKNIKIATHKYYKTKGKVRVMSLFNVGLTLFKLAVNSLKYIRIPFYMIYKEKKKHLSDV